MKIIFWVAIFFIFYTYIGYGLLLYLLLIFKRIFLKKPIKEFLSYTPSVTIVVAAFNEAYIIEEKILNTLALNYPSDSIEYIFITDGSTDETASIVAKYPSIKGMHQAQRNGKIAAVHRAMNEIKSEIVVFTDANTMVNKEAIINICKHYIDPTVGAIAGEKRVQIESQSDATAGEGFYWKYESKLKQWDSELYSVVGAAGELFSIRSSLYQPVEPDTVLDDFMISMNIALKGYRIVYEPAAFATETASANTNEELKRKIRIAAGGIQSTIRLWPLFIPFKNPVLTFEFISHRVLRWVVTPYLMIGALVLNMLLVKQMGIMSIYGLMLFGQSCIFLAAIFGWILEKQKLKVKVFFIPYYFCLMNYAVIAGMYRYFFTKQSVLWEKAKRK
ncbi:MAG: glycosyltransferase family 2 protein [Sphingobacteriia bacterium]|jgi:cellulose synthase/poly-beta-1,6-N-acetylglucosamine synthase-like glycosyltransferase